MTETPNADHAVDLHEGGGTSTPHGEFRPPIVVGGRYVVGENPTDSFGMGPEGVRYLADDRNVNVEGIDDMGRGACCYDDASGHFVGYIDPRYLTPAPDPVSDGFRQSDTSKPSAPSHLILDRSRQPNGEHAATCACGATMFADTPQLRDDVVQAHLKSQTTPEPAVDDELLLTIAQALYGDALEDEPAHMRAVLASEPMQRLKAAWATEVRGAGRDMLRMVGEALGRSDAEPMWLDELARQVVRERDDALTEATRLRTREGDLEVWLQRIAEAFDMGTDDLTDEEVVSNLEELRSHRDELGQRVDQQNEELGALRRTNPSTTLSAAAVEVVRALNAAGIVGDDTAGAGWPWIGKAVDRSLTELQRLRDEIAAVTLELIPDVPAEFIDAHGLPAAVTQLIRERDESRADLLRSTDTVAFLRDELSTEADRASTHFDRAMSAEVEVDRLRATRQTGDLEDSLWQALRDAAPRPFPDNLLDAVEQLCAQAAQQFPDVGPVTRHESGVPVCGGRFLNRNYGPDDFRRMAANSRENAQEELWNAAIWEQFAAHLDAERRLLEAVDAEASDTSNDAPSVVCLCGSTRFRSEFVEANRALTMEGKIVVAPGVFQHDGDPLTEDEKAVLDLLHLQKIDLADEVFVVNPGGYIGDSTRREIEYARRTGKPVSFLEAEAADTSSDDEPTVGDVLDRLAAVITSERICTCTNEDPCDLHELLHEADVMLTSARRARSGAEADRG